MATWIAHIRLAEKMLDSLKDIDIKAFLVGNIGPDSGVPNEDWSNFDSPKVTTHWYDEAGEMNPQNFYDTYFTEGAKGQKEYYSFILGYYIHLLTDVEWTKLYASKMQEPTYQDNLQNNPEFIWQIKKDWYGLDFLYLKENPDSVFFQEFIEIKEVPDYLDYFPKGAFTRQVDYITRFYLGENKQTQENFIYLSKQEMNHFIDDAVREVTAQLQAQQII